MSISFLNAQSHKNCIAHERLHQKMNDDESYKNQREKIEKEVALIIQQKQQIENVIVIPVVIHVIHNGDAEGVQENISEDLILEQLRQLNEDYSRTNSNYDDTPEAFKNVSADTEIQFCLTELDPNGLETEGIQRYHISELPNVSESDCWTPDYIDQNIIMPTIWDRNDFLNIYSVIAIDEMENNSCNFFSHLGYGQFPGGNPDTDAVVAAFYTWGSLDMSNPLVNAFKGRTITHEVGHWLNLFHTWGQNMGGCNDDDGLSDTPDQNEPAIGCPSYPAFDNCTGSGDGIMYNNFMDYSDDACMTMFTEQQADRIRATIDVSRQSLTTAPCSSSAILGLFDINNFTLKQDDLNVDLSWKALSEEQGTYFVEHKTEESDWMKIGEVEQRSLNTEERYAFKHLAPNLGVNYYRIKHYSVDNVINSSDVRLISIDLLYDQLVFPIPATDQLTIVNPFSSEELKIEIRGINGQLISKTIINDRRKTQMDVSNLSNGIYYLTLSSGEKVRYINWIKA